MSPHLDEAPRDEAGIKIPVDKPHQSDDKVKMVSRAQWTTKADLPNRAAGT